MRLQTLNQIIRSFGMLHLWLILLFAQHFYAATSAPSLNTEIQEKAQQFFKNACIQPVVEEAKTRDDPIAIHLFWGANIPEKALHDEYNANRTVHIGGSEWHRYFFEGLDAFLLNTPANVRIIFTHCPLTYAANQAALDSCAEKFKGRFLLCPLAEAIDQFKAHHPDSNLDQALELATMGQAAIASDAYRLIATNYVGQHLIPDSKSRLTNTYTDVDTFLNMMGFGTYFVGGFDDYLKSQAPLLSVLLTAPEEGNYESRVGTSGGTGNDVVRIRPSAEKPIEWFVTAVIEQGRFRPQEFASYQALFKGLEEDPHFDGTAYLARHDHLSSVLPQISVMSVFGPYLVQLLGIEGYMSSLPALKTTSTFSWKETELSFLDSHLEESTFSYLKTFHCADEETDTIRQELIKTGHELLGLPDFRKQFWKAFPVCKDIEGCLEIFKKYLGILEYTKRLGDAHPFNRTLLARLKEHSPFNTEYYKTGLSNLFPSLEGRKAIQVLLGKREGFGFHKASDNLRDDRYILLYYVRTQLREMGINEGGIDEIASLMPTELLTEEH